MSGLGALLPAGVACAESARTLDEGRLLPEERPLVARATAPRRSEFATARHCARRALAAAGVAPVPILRDGRAPLWPPGVVGSITHCRGYHAAAVAPSVRFRSLGIDAEPDEPLPAEVLDMIAGPEERRWLRADGAADRHRVLFSAKESVYKAWYPLTRDWLGFEDAVLTLRPDGTFTARILISGPVRAVEGRWRRQGGLVLTVVAIPA